MERRASRSLEFGQGKALCHPASFQDLSELYHLDISYNHLCLVPRMGPSGATLGTLILRGNELQGLHGEWGVQWW